jgi:hypothetical protein
LLLFGSKFKVQSLSNQPLATLDLELALALELENPFCF